MDVGAVPFVVGAGLVAGAVNAVVGGGSLVTFPVLVAAGLSPLQANVSNNIGVLPGSLGAVHEYRGEPELALKQADAGVAHAIEHGIVTHHQWAMLSRGFAVAELGAVEEGLEQMRDTLAAQRATGETIIFPYWLSLFADALLKIKAEDPELLRTAPHTHVISRPDEVKAAKEPVLRWKSQN